MSFELTIISSVVSVAIGVIASIFSAWASHKRKKILEQKRKRADESIRRAINMSISEYSKQLPPSDVDEFYKALINHGEQETEEEIGQSQEEITEIIKEKMDEKLTHLNDKISKIEQRFPDQGTIDKVSSVNDAILATQIEAINKRLESIEQKMLSRWDVAKIGFQIIAAFGAIIGIALGVINFYIKNNVG